MDQSQKLKFFEDYKFIATIRCGSAEDAEAMIKAASNGGVRIFEISVFTPQVSRLIENFSRKDNFLFGAGGITDGEMAQRVLSAGAAFISSYYTDHDVISVAKNNDSFVIQGALTATEAVSAYQRGADMVSIYPADFAGGPDYIRSIRGPLPFLKLIADGGVTLDNAFEYLKSCVAVNVSKALFDRSLIRSDNWSEITERAKLLTQKLEALRVTK